MSTHELLIQRASTIKI